MKLHAYEAEQSADFSETFHPIELKSEILYLFKHIFWGAARRTNPTVRQFFKGSIWRDIPIRITFLRIVDITADHTSPFFHLDLQMMLIERFT